MTDETLKKESDKKMSVEDFYYEWICINQYLLRLISGSYYVDDSKNCKSWEWWYTKNHIECIHFVKNIYSELHPKWENIINQSEQEIFSNAPKLSSWQRLWLDILRWQNKGTRLFLFNETGVNDLTINNTNLSYLSQNLISQIKKDLLEFFEQLSFDIEYETEIVYTEDNFDNLLIDKDHPSRSITDTFYFSDDLMLRTHCTSNSIKKLREKSEEIQKNNLQYKLVTIGPVYRKDDEDSRHTEQFHQLDLIFIDKKLNLANLKWIMIEVIKHIFGQDIKYKFRNSFFPFTQPSYELDMKCSCNDSKECSTCSGTGWIEILGCGLIHRQILKNANYSDEYGALAAGIGIERLAMIKYKLTDIRNLYQNNFRQLKNDC